MAFFSAEIPTGTIDGLNTSFSVAHPISKVDDVFVDGAVYFDYTVVNGEQTLTLSDAPTATLRIDYYDTASYVTATGITSEDLRTDFDRLLKDTSDVSSNLFNLWLNFISNFTYRNLIDQEPERFIVNHSYTVTTDTDDYSLPSDFWSMNKEGTGLFKLNSSGTLDGELTRTSYKSTLEGYYINGNTVKMTPESRSKGFSMVLRYLPRISQISGVDSQIPIPTEFKEMILEALKKFYYEWDRNGGEEQMADQRFTRALEEMMQEYSRTADTFKWDDTSLYY